MKNWNKWLLVFIGTFFFSTVVMAEEVSSKYIEYLVQEKNDLTRAINAVNSNIAPTTQAEFQARISQNARWLSLNHAKIISFQASLAHQKSLQQKLTQRIKYLQQNNSSSNADEDAVHITALLEINKKSIEVLEENLVLASRYQTSLLQQETYLKLWLAKAEMHQRLEDIHTQELKLQAVLQALYLSSTHLQQDIQENLSPEVTANHYVSILYNNQLMNLAQYDLSELNLEKKIIHADFALQRNPDIRVLQAITDTYREVILEFSQMKLTLQQMLSTLKDEQLYMTNTVLRQKIDALIRSIKARIETITIKQLTLQKKLEKQEQLLKQQLAARQSFSEYRPESWPYIAQQLANTPIKLSKYTQLLFLKVYDHYVWQDTWPEFLGWGVACSILLFYGFLYVFLKKQTPESVARRLSGHVYDSLLALFLKNIPFLGIITLLAWIFYSTHIPFANYALLAHIVAVFLLYRIVTFFARFILLERSIDESGSDVRLYQRLMWLFRCGALLSACLLITEELPLPLLLQDLFHRLLMLYLCVVAIVLWRSKEVITHVLRPFLKGKKRYFQSAVLLVVALLPITLLTTAVVGLIGYINLAWTMGAYQAEILSLLSVYVLLRGLLLEALDYISEWMVDSLYNGWLWTEVFLKPFDKIARLSLFGGLVLSMGVVFNLHADSPFVLTLINIAHYPFVDFSGIHITSVSVVEFIILSCFLAWTAKWAREFSYRWLYRHTKDTGIRNSLAVFTQYGIIAIGGVIALHVLGFDFSGLSMILGGLAVGMGFGLRDFASNIVGGLMLLIERPVREGDLITLGDYEGRVAHIGIRSMRVSSWDNMEVLIPNAETFNKPFTNWTHQDSIVRTVVPFKVSRADDPLKVQALIFEVLIHTPEVLKDPIPQVFLTQIDEVLIQFEARYFINVELYTRFEVRSNILFKIMELFEKEGIQAPIPQMKVNLGDEPFGEECTHG